MGCRKKFILWIWMITNTERGFSGTETNWKNAYTLKADKNGCRYRKHHNKE